MAGNGPRGQELGVGYISLTVDTSAAAAQIQNDVGAAGQQAGQQGGQQAAAGFKQELGDKLKTGLTATGVGIGAAAAGGIVAGLTQAMDEADLVGSIQAQIGVGVEEAGRIADAAGDAYKAGWGESLGEVGSTAASLQQVLTELGDTADLATMTADATALAGVFGQDLPKVVNSAGNLVRTGLVDNMTDAMNIMATGFQSNGKLSEDFLDSIDEYGVQFKSAGISAADALGMMNQSLSAGARNGDLVVDALKEWSLRGMDLGNKDVVAAYESLGFSAEEMANKVVGGGPAAKQAMQQVLDALRSTDDPMVKATSAAALFGTQYEDLKSSLDALNPATAAEGFTDIAGAAGELTGSAKGAEQILNELGRSLTDALGEALAPLLPKLLQLGDIGLRFFQWMAENPVIVQIMLGIGLAIGVMTSAVWLFNAAVYANPFTWFGALVVGIIAVVVAVIWLIASNWDTICASITERWNSFTHTFTTAIKGAQLMWGDFTGSVRAKWDELTWAVTDGVERIKLMWHDFCAGIAAKISTAVTGAKHIWGEFTGWLGGMVDRAGDGLRNMWSGVKDAAAGPLNWVIDKLNSVINLVNKASRFVGKFTGVNLKVKNIPGLATGGTVTGSGTVMVGERGPELLRLPQGASVIPLSHPAANVGTGGSSKTVNYYVTNPVAERASTSTYKSASLLGASFV